MFRTSNRDPTPAGDAASVGSARFMEAVVHNHSEAEAECGCYNVIAGLLPSERLNRIDANGPYRRHDGRE
jgi:hypothetical protein